jgi:hypothetical protein
MELLARGVLLGELGTERFLRNFDRECAPTRANGYTAEGRRVGGRFDSRTSIDSTLPYP